MENPKVSVIIPVYNGEKTLKQCLDSVLNQTYKNYEVIAIDNCSTDKTKDIIKKFQSKNEKVSYVFERRRSRGAARNAGIKVAKGEIIAITDGDCVVPENWIEELTKPIIYENETAVMGFEEELIKNYWAKNIQKANWKFFQRNLNGEYINCIDTKNFAIKSSIIKKMMFDSSLSNFEDFDLSLRLKKLIKIRFVPSVRVKHNHESRFINVVKLNFDRAYWTTKIFQKHKGVKDEIMTESISIKNFALFPFWIMLQFMIKPWGEAFFLLVSEVSWRVGILWALLNPSSCYTHSQKIKFSVMNIRPNQHHPVDSSIEEK